MADEIGTVRVELIADPSGIKRGIEEAGGALQRFAAVGTAVGNLLAQAFTEIASRMTEMISGLLDGTSELFGRLSNDARQATRLIGRSFAEAGEQATQFQSALLERVLPGIAAVIERFAQAGRESVLLKAGFEVLVGTIKTLATAGAVVAAIFEGLSAAVTRVLMAVGQVSRGEFAAALETLKGHFSDLASNAQRTAGLIADIWQETAITATRAGVAGKMGSEEAANAAEQAMARVARANREAAAEAMQGWEEWRRTREQALRDTMMDVTSNPTAGLEERMAAIRAAYEGGAITVGKFHRAVRDAEEANAKVMANTMTMVGQALTTVFAKSKPAAVASALINTYVGVSQALRLPWPFNLAQVAAVGAIGFAQVRNIMSTNVGGGGSGGSAPTSVPTASDGGAYAGPTQTLQVQGIDPGSLISGASMRELATRLLDYQRNGGQVVLA